MAGGAAVLLLFVLFGIWALSDAMLGSSKSIERASLRELPARPADIEKHGELARTMLPPDDARARNERVGFEPRREAAAPFAFAGSEVDRDRAIQCLATAVLYEAGDDTVGQSAVAQVVLNRVRHPAFPSTVCGVVYQGSTRSTGCQFTFTCDGSLRRAMSDTAWRRARNVAQGALAGQVDRTVGLATHYHTDWVYPYWSPSLRKLARVGTHLFFGWPGNWGARSAFRNAYRGNEAQFGSANAAPGIAGSDEDGAFAAPVRESGILGLPQAPAKLPAGMGAVPLYGNKLRLSGSDGHSFGLLSPPGMSASQVVNAALSLCGQPGPCRVNAWGNEDDIPASYPLPALTRATMVFEYVRSGAGGAATIRFDCSRFPNKDPKACLDRPADVPEVLAGVRFR